MTPRSLQSRLLFTFVTLMILGLGGVIVLSGIQLSSQLVERNKHDLELQAQIIANALRDPVARDTDGDHSAPPPNPTNNGRSLDTLIGSYAQGIDGRVTLVDNNLNVIYSSDNLVPAQYKESHIEFAAARLGMPEADIRWDDWRKEQRMYIAVPVPSEHNQILGYVQLSIPTAPMYAELGQTWLMFLLIGGGILVLTAIVSTIIARQIAVPVLKLTATSEQIAAGKLDERVQPEGPNEIRRLGIAFNQMTERVQAMMLQQRAFVDNAAHELRSPLTSLRLRIEMLQTRGNKDAALTERYLGQMEHEVGYLQRMVDHLLALATAENNAQSVPMTALDLAPILHSTTDNMIALAHQAGLQLETDLPDHLPVIQANPDQMTILIRNLIDNAIKYSRRGGSITVSAKTAGKEILIAVTDTGVGIPAEALPFIFDRFYRVDKSHSRAQGGAGLGLSLVQAITQAHGGRIEVASQVNQGSTFTVHLPMRSI